MDCEPFEGSPIVKNLSVAILQLSEAGELAYLRSKWWASSCMAGKGRSAAMQPHSLRGMFLVLSLGLGLGALAAILELTSKSRHNAAEQKVRLTSAWPTTATLNLLVCRQKLQTVLWLLLPCIKNNVGGLKTLLLHTGIRWFFST